MSAFVDTLASQPPSFFTVNNSYLEHLLGVQSVAVSVAGFYGEEDLCSLVVDVRPARSPLIMTP